MSQIDRIIPGTLNSLWTVQAEETEADTKNSSSISNTGSSAQKAQQAYGMNRINQLAEAAQLAFEGLGLGPNDKVTFSRINEYKAQQQENFSQKVEAGLKEIGISADTEYQIVTKYEGEGVDIVTESPEKSKIELFFKDNPELVDEFKEIQYLDNLTKTLNNENISQNMNMTRIQLQSMSSIFNTNPSSSIMSYGEGGTFFGRGLSTIV